MISAMARSHDPSNSQDDDARWSAVQNRDRDADGTFFYSVRTTGVYCRPSCSARLPRRENVQFHASCAEAERAGFRACKRCRPNGEGVAEQHSVAIAKACRLIETSETMPSLDVLAEAAGMSRFHFHRVFKDATGLTPKAFANARRAERMRDELSHSDSVTEAIYGAGFNSSGRFYAASADALGMAPKDFRAGGKGETIRFALGESSLGSILVAATEKGICAISLGDDPADLLRALEDRFPEAELVGGDADFEQLVATVVGLVEKPERAVDLPLDIRGTAFQQRVWKALRAIPPGKTASYAEIADDIGAPKSVRAVAGACAANNLAIVIPCHRVVRNDGAISGYRWGVARKRSLLAREAGK
jgi:AraC family transcriptional regulator of adaptative response/methylated-DNA-[protein]-cysteine methyltransferase